MDYFKAQTKTSPLFVVDRSERRIEIKGRSTPEGSVQLYYPIIRRIKEIFKGYTGKITVEVALEYINTSSTKCLYDLLKTVINLENVEPEIRWFYEDGDDDMVETGEDFEEVLGIRFVYFPLAEIEL